MEKHPAQHLKVGDKADHVLAGSQIILNQIIVFEILNAHGA
jgi:hypothetical protein